MREPPQEPALLESGDQAVDARFRRQVERLLHFVEGWRDAGFLDAFVNEHQKFVLFAREHRRLASSGRPEQTKNDGGVLWVFSFGCQVER